MNSTVRLAVRWGRIVFASSLLLFACDSSESPTGPEPEPEPEPQPPISLADEITERSLVEPTGWYWLRNVDFETLDAKIDEGFRLIDIEIMSTSPFRVSAAFVADDGVHHKGWWRYVSDEVDIEFIEKKIAEHDARILDLETFVVNGQRRYGVILVDNTGDRYVDWWWYVNASVDELVAAAENNEARIVDLDTHVIDGVRYYNAVMISNTGETYKDWSWYVGASHEFIEKEIEANDVRILDIERIGDDSYTVVFEPREGKGWWWWLEGTSDQINAIANQNAARVIDIEPTVSEGEATLYTAILLENGVPSDIPVTQVASDELEPVVDALKDFMRYRCVGAATLGISVDGQPVGVFGLGRMDGRAANAWNPECGDDFAPPLADRVSYDTPMRVGSVSKPITAAVTRWAIKSAAFQSAGILMSDDQVEGLLLFDPNNYPPLIPGTDVQYPLPLIPMDLYELFAGLEPYPVAVSDAFRFGGNANTEQLCGDLTSGFADPQWQSVTLGHLLGHRSGLQRSAPAADRDVAMNFPILRGPPASQEQALRDEWGDAAVDAARADLELEPGEGFIVPGGTLEESMRVLAGRCLRYPLGTRSYSNTSPALPQIIIRQLNPAGRYTAGVNDPGSHGVSALAAFFRTQLGVLTSGTEGAFLTLYADDVPGYPNREPTRRHWDGQAYYWDDWDQKRPHCVVDADGSCSFAPWRDNSPGRTSWAFGLERVPFWYTGTGASPGTGSIAIEPEVMLRFMAKYWVNGGLNTDGVNPRIGEERSSPLTYAVHNGAGNGMFSWAIQLSGTGNPTTATIPPLDDDGRITDDFANLAAVSVSLPNGVDVFVAINQRGATARDNNGVITSDLGDRRCAQDTSYACDVAYGTLPDFLFYGLSQVDWSAVEAPPELLDD